MPLYAGIDAGQSSTVAVVGDESGAVLGRGSSGPGDEIGADSTSTRLRDALRGALASALQSAGFPSNTQIDRIVAGVSGYEGRIYGGAPGLPSNDVRFEHDSAIAHAGALDGKNGVLVIAGTGSVALAVDDDRRETLVGGWGYLFGDEGSAFWIARAAMRVAIAHHPCDGEKKLLDYFKRDSLRAIARAFYVGEIDRATFAGFARECLQAMREHTVCLCLYQPALSAVRSLASLAQSAARHAPHARRVSFVGGLVSDAFFRGAVEAATRAQLPDWETVAPVHEPAVGALLRARQA